MRLRIRLLLMCHRAALLPLLHSWRTTATQTLHYIFTQANLLMLLFDHLSCFLSLSLSFAFSHSVFPHTHLPHTHTHTKAWPQNLAAMSLVQAAHPWNQWGHGTGLWTAGLLGDWIILVCQFTCTYTTHTHTHTHTYTWGRWGEAEHVLHTEQAVLSQREKEI